MRIVIRTLAILSIAALALAAAPVQAQHRHGGFHGGYHGHDGYHEFHGYHGDHWGPWPLWGGLAIGLGIGLGASSWDYGCCYGAYYAPGYVVVQPPPVAYTAPPAPPSPPDPVIYPRNGQSAEQTEADRQACNRWATTVPSALADAAVFQRAVAACMDARGYTVR
jgi:hypothetical protein